MAVLAKFKAAVVTAEVLHKRYCSWPISHLTGAAPSFELRAASSSVSVITRWICSMRSLTRRMKQIDENAVGGGGMRKDGGAQLEGGRNVAGGRR